MSAVMIKRIDWRRARKDRLPNGVKRCTWVSNCGHYRLEEHRLPGGGQTFLGFVREVAGFRFQWRQLARQYSRQRVVDVCECHAGEEFQSQHHYQELAIA